MNVFVLDLDPERAAQMQCDKHVVKMVLETAQLLCAAFPEGSAPYKRTHYNHPCAKWTRESIDNFVWLVGHGLALSDEYTYRYGKQHKSHAAILWCMQHTHLLDIPAVGLTPFAQAMPDQYKRPDAVDAYRAYYRGGKAEIATWNRSRKPPAWWQGEMECRL